MGPQEQQVNRSSNLQLKKEECGLFYTQVKANKSLIDRVNTLVSEGNELKSSFLLALAEQKPEVAYQFIKASESKTSNSLLKDLFKLQISEGLILNPPDKNIGTACIKIEGKFKAENIKGILKILGPIDKSLQDRILNSDIYLVNEKESMPLGRSVGGVSIVNLPSINEAIISQNVVNKKEFIQSIVANELMTQTVFNLFGISADDQIDWSKARCILSKNNIKPLSTNQVQEFLSDAASLNTNHALLAILINNMVVNKVTNSSDMKPYSYANKFLDEVISEIHNDKKQDLGKIYNNLGLLKKMNSDVEALEFKTDLLDRASSDYLDGFTKEKKDKIIYELKTKDLNTVIQDLVKNDTFLMSINRDLSSIRLEKDKIEQDFVKLVNKTSSDYLNSLSQRDLDTISNRFSAQGQEFIKVMKNQVLLPTK